MNNKPVAWMRESDKAVCSNDEKLWFIEEEGSDWNYIIPLYTHPADLTDEEIMDCIEDKTGYSFNACDEDLLDFARAILRKASEK